MKVTVKKIYILFSLCLFASVVFFHGCTYEATEITYEQLKEWMEEGIDMTIIDTRTPEEWAGGHIQDAINIPYEDFIDETGNVVDTSILASAVPKKSEIIVTYCFGYGKADAFAEKAAELGYRNVYYYHGGTNDWDKHNDYYVIEYSAFKLWYDSACPFDKNTDVLLDVLPEAWYTGDDLSHPGGHICGAINIWAENFVSDGEIIDEGESLIDVVKNKDVKLVIYCGNYGCGLSLEAAKAAIALGYTHVYRYQGGWQEWQDEGNELCPGEEPGSCSQ